MRLVQYYSDFDMDSLLSMNDYTLFFFCVTIYVLFLLCYLRGWRQYDEFNFSILHSLYDDLIAHKYRIINSRLTGCDWLFLWICFRYFCCSPNRLWVLLWGLMIIMLCELGALYVKILIRIFFMDFGTNKLV